MNKRVLILSNYAGGLLWFRKELLQALYLRGFDVTVSVPDDEMAEQIEALGCKLIRTKMSRRGMNPISDISLLCHYWSMIKKIKPKLVYTYTIKPNVYGGIACRLLRTPYVENITGLGTTIENEGILQKLTLAMYKIGLRKAQKVFFQNQTNKDFMLRKGVIRTPYSVLPGSGVNLEYNAYSEYPSEEMGVKFLFVGRIMKDKGIEEYLKCAELIRERYPTCTFDIVGGFDEEVYRPIVEKYDSDGVIHYFGKQKEARSFMISHHILIQPSYHEGLSNVLLEASACGRPVLATNVPGCRETFDEGVSGYGFEAKNTDSLVYAVERILALTSEERMKMGQAARKKVEQEFSRQLVINAYLNELDSI